MDALTDKEFLDKWEAECAERMLYGCILQHCWLGNSAQSMTQSAGAWVVPIRVKDMFRLLELARSKK
jgi:hypothetical protein